MFSQPTHLIEPNQFSEDDVSLLALVQQGYESVPECQKLLYVKNFTGNCSELAVFVKIMLFHLCSIVDRRLIKGQAFASEGADAVLNFLKKVLDRALHS